MVLANGEINIIADMEGTTGVKLHNNRQKLRARFDIRRKLGQGTYGKVQLAVNKETSEEVAIKTIKKSKIETEQDLVRIQREIQIMSSVQHPHIIHIYEVFENREKIVLVMEYANGGELYDYLSFKKVLTEAEARRIFRQVASAVFYCHKNMICHRDLKLENILLDERGNAKIADFGLSNIFNERNFLSTFCGSPLYASPEIVQGTPYYGPEVDCWSLGVLLYTLVYGAMPFDGSNFKKLVKQISEGDYYEPRVPSDASGLIRKMLTVDPAKRASVDVICCDRWVDVGEEIPLLDVAQDMCKLMPVRLDYLLALTAAQPPVNPEESCNDDDLKKGLDANDLKQDMSCETKENNGVLAAEEDEMDQWERPALQALDSATGLSNKDAQVNGEVAKKHKLPSSSSVLGNSSTANVLRKKKKNETTTSDDDNDRDGGGEKIMQANVEAMDASAAESDRAASPASSSVALTNNSVPTTEAVSEKEEPNALSNEQVNEPPSADSEQEASLDKPDTEAVPANVSDSKQASEPVSKSKSSISKKLGTGLSLSIGEKTKKGQSEVASSPSSSAPAGSTKVPKLRKSISKDGATETTPPSAGTEKRKMGFPPSRISDVRKSFERKSPEKKSLNIPGSKVSSFKNKFESPTTTPEALVSPTKLVPKPLSGFGAPGKVSLAKTGAQVSEPQDKKPEDGTPESTSNGKKPAVLTRQPSRGNARTSPTKSLKNDKGAATDQNGQHHRGCVPHDARVAAAQDPKTSPPKTMSFKRRSPPATNSTAEVSNRKNSLSKTGSGISRVAPAKDTPPARRPVGSIGNGLNRSGSSSGPRPKSPTKVVKAKTGSTSNELAPLPVAEVGAAQGFENPEEAAPKADLESSSQVEGQDVDKQLEVWTEGSKTKSEKRGSIEIAPLPASALARLYPENIEEETPGIGTPLVRFIPRDQGQFHLIGVKSEVMFDVAAGEPASAALEAPKVESQVSKPEKDDDSKIIRYIATVRRHGSSDEQLDDGPERVTLIDLRCSATCDDLTEDAGPSTAVANVKAVPQEESSSNREMKAKSKTQAVQVEEEQRGYSMYRSKYRSIQKFRSVVEKRGGEGEEVVEEKSSTKASVDQGRAASLERSDSFSSTGSNDDLEDVFESLTSESLFTSLLSRTRNLINRLTEGDAHTTRWFQSSLLGRSGVSIGGTIPSSVSSFMLNTPNISVRFNQPGASGRQRYGDAPKSTYRISARSGCDLGRSNSAREYDSDAMNYASDSCDRSSGNRTTPRWRPKSRKAKEDDDMAFMSDTGGSGFRSHQSSFSNFNSNRSSVTMSSSLRSKEDLARRSRYDAFRSRDLQDEPSDVLAALMRHRNRSLDTHRPRSFYEPESQSQQASADATSDAGRESLYGTVRRPTRFQRYTKSVSKELSEEYEAEESTLHRPRSMVALAEPKAAASVSVSRDYSKNVSQTGNTKREEEEEYEREHRVTEQEGGRVTTLRRETKRSVSQTQDSDGAGKTVDAELQNAAATAAKKPMPGDGDFLSRQDSGIGSMHESSTPATPTSAGAQSRKGYMRFARSVSNELESLEEEINRIGIGKRYQGAKSSPDEAEGRAATPASDSAETGSVCSDGTAASTDTLNSSSQHQRAPEEESVGDRIRRKSFFPRFNESSRIPRKGRMTGASTMSGSSSTASMRSELSRAPSFRHHHLYDDDPTFATPRYFDPSPDFYSGSLNRSGGSGTQRWSMHFGPGSGDADYQYGNDPPPSTSTARRRGSGGGNPDVMAYLRRGADPGPEDGLEPGMMSRTHSLPEEASPPLRPVFRQHSMPGSHSNGNGQPEGEGGQRSSAPRRPSRLGLHTRSYSPCEETGESLATSPSGAPSSGRSWRRSRFGSSDPLEGWESARARTGASFASLMGSLESPSEVLQKAMDLCDSLRFS